MTAREFRRPARRDPPGVHHSQDSGRRPDRVRDVVEGELETVSFRLMTLRTGSGDPADDVETAIEIVMRGRGDFPQFLRDPSRDQNRVVTPRHDVVEEDVAVRDKHFASGEVEVVERREIGVVVAAEERRAGRVAREKIHHRGVTLGRVRRIGPHARVEGISIQDNVRHSVEQRAELGQSIDAAGVIAEMDVRENARDGNRHKVSAAQLGRRKNGNKVKTAATLLDPGR